VTAFCGGRDVRRRGGGLRTNRRRADEEQSPHKQAQEGERHRRCVPTHPGRVKAVLAGKFGAKVRNGAFALELPRFDMPTGQQAAGKMDDETSCGPAVLRLRMRPGGLCRLITPLLVTVLLTLPAAARPAPAEQHRLPYAAHRQAPERPARVAARAHHPKRLALGDHKGRAHRVARNDHAAHSSAVVAGRLPLIVIDPGHGGRDPGAVGASGTLEKTVTLTTAMELRHLLLTTGRYRVALTRTTDRFVSLSDRLRYVRSHQASLFVAIHADASRDPRARGASVYVRTGAGSGASSPRLAARATGKIARALADATPQPAPGSDWLQYTMIHQLTDDIRMTGAPARDGRLYVLGAQSVPSVLLEMGFLSNRREEALLKQTAHRAVIAKAVRDAVADYFEDLRMRGASRT